ncbi:MAG: hypothetical protein KGL39_48560 [Patescibacteria group bacterium]|nr:hypothetical protein [Patescibacteria group bacterium]
MSMLAALIVPPTNAIEWDRYAFINRDQIQLINAAIQTQYGVNLVEYPIYPMPRVPDEDATTWLEWVQLAHQQFTSVLGLQSQDIEELNFRNQNQVVAWVNAAYLELYDASAKLGV